MNINDQQPVTEGLRFGTAGLRAPVGPGAQEMNVTQVTRTTAGVASWLAERAAARAASGAQQHHPDPDTEALLGEIHGNIDDGALKVAVGFDARYGSHTFAVTAAEVFAGAGFEVTLLPTPTPTPVLAWLVKYRGLDAGVQITASHNPASDNGYKVYVDGGSQLISPDDREIEKHIARISLDDVANIPRVTVRPAPDQLLHYLDAVVSLVEPASSDRLRVNNERADLKVAYTALHGVGGRALKQALQWAGFAMTWSVASQHYPDPTFPTVDFPNPEEPGATDQLIELGQQVDADILVALDPDADRCAIGIRTEDTDGHSGRRHFRMLRGDELGPLLATRIVDTRMATTRKAFGTVAAPVVATTVVSSQLLGNIATRLGLPRNTHRIQTPRPRSHRAPRRTRLRLRRSHRHLPRPLDGSRQRRHRHCTRRLLLGSRAQSTRLNPGRATRSPLPAARLLPRNTDFRAHPQPPRRHHPIRKHMPRHPCRHAPRNRLAARKPRAHTDRHTSRRRLAAHGRNPRRQDHRASIRHRTQSKVLHRNPRAHPRAGTTTAAAC